MAVPASFLRRRRGARLASQRRLVAATHRGVLVSRLDHGPCVVADLCRRIRNLAVCAGLGMELGARCTRTGTGAADVYSSNRNSIVVGRWRGGKSWQGVFPNGLQYMTGFQNA